MKKPFLLFATISLLLSGSAFAGLKTHQAADLVLGQPDFMTEADNLSQTGMNGPRDVAIDPRTGKVFVADSGNDRILRFASYLSLSNGDPAEAVLGQDDFDTNDSTDLAQNRMNSPTRLYIDVDGRLWVTDLGNNRVLRFENASFRPSGSPADGVLGQPDFTSKGAGTTATTTDTPFGITGSPNGTIWVAERDNHRVLRFDNAALKVNGAPADAVLGQPDFTSNGTGFAATQMNTPIGVFFDSNGNLWVGENGNSRVLRFDNAENIVVNGATADGVLGAPDFTAPGADTTTVSTMRNASDLVVDSQGTLFVSDSFSRRVLGFLDAANKVDGADADIVLGQPDFTTSSANLTAEGMINPTGLAVDPLGRLYVADQGYHRVTRYSPDGTPTITIKGKKSTRSSNLTLRGTALSDLLVTKVQVKGKRGGFKNANGTTNWTYRLRGLDLGTTKVKVKATSLDGKTAIKTVRVRRR
ncbi:MAG: NHL repeat-containing protein [Verrucomicrobiae bacterium]|nr:NHL repeat-containing protein [Verrucomicrobiae bacterium]